ncbi:MAG TPA: hypothetical protein VIQ97_03260 [Prevotella sp.]
MYKQTYQPLQDISPQIAKERPTLRSGIASLTNLRGSKKFRRYILSSDTEAIRKDWIAVGNALKMSMQKYGK